MPRCARQKSSTDIYHVIIRGINRQEIFEENEDRRKLLFIMRDSKVAFNCKIYAYCLMSNHVHLLLHACGDPINLIMKNIEGRYVRYFNEKYGRIGPLFQDRYKSENVEDDRYFLTVFRYIIQNPMKAGIEKKLGTYPWSSYGAYDGNPDNTTDISFVLDMIGGKDRLLEFLSGINDDSVMDISSEKLKLSDEEVKKIMFSLTGCKSVSDYQKMTDLEQANIIIVLHKNGLSLAQIARLTGKTKAMVYKVVNLRGKVSQNRGTVPLFQRTNETAEPSPCFIARTGVLC